jgi:hypothetical protein
MSNAKRWSFRRVLLSVLSVCMVALIAGDTGIYAGKVGSNVSDIETEMSTDGKPVYAGPISQPDKERIRQGGDMIEDATIIPELPWTDVGTTLGYTDNYDETCPTYAPGSPDVVYAFTPGMLEIVNITLCNGSEYDTKLYVYAGGYTPGEPYACNDDACPDYQSEIKYLQLDSGMTYYFVVDGYGGDAGNYVFQIGQPMNCTVDCPPEATDEGEPCGENLNGGCGSPELDFRTIECGEIVCATIWAEEGWRDTDWYELYLAEPTAITWTVNSETPVLFSYLAGCPMGDPDCSCISGPDPYTEGGYCTDISLTMELNEGYHWFWVGHQFFYNEPCGWFNTYTATMSCGLTPPNTIITAPSDTAWWNDHPYFSDLLHIEAVDHYREGNVIYTDFEFFDGGWQHIYTDHDGTDNYKDEYDTLAPDGDGWSAYWEPVGIAEGYYDIRATMTGESGLQTSDTITVYYDPYPPVPTIYYPSVFNYVTSAPVDIWFTTDADNIEGMYLTVLPLPASYPERTRGPDADTLDCFQGYNKGIPGFNQNDLYPDGADGNNWGCYPTSVAACLKYWAQNGYPGLDGNGTMTDAEMVNEVADSMGTRTVGGTNDADAKAGTEAYIKAKLEPCKFKVEHITGNDVTLKRYLKEMFENDEDVIPSDKHHVVVGNSFCVHPQFYVDFMDPAKGDEEQSTDWNKGFDGDKLTDMLIISPKEDTTVEIPDSVDFPQEEPPGSGDYHGEWEPSPEEYPPGQGYLVEVVIIDNLGHVGWDMVKIELILIGDADGSGEIDIDDVVYLIQYIFSGGTPPVFYESGDANCSGFIDIDDVVYLINYIFAGGPEPGDPDGDGVPDC